MIYQYAHHHSPSCHTWTCILPHFFGVVAFILGSHQKAFEVYLYTMFSLVFLKFSPSSFMYGTTILDFLWWDVFWFCWLLILWLVLFTKLDLWIFLNSLLCIAHMGYLHFVNTSSRCVCSWCNSCWLEHTALAKWKRVLMTLFWYGLVAVQLKVEVNVGELSVYFGCQGTICH